MITKPIVAGSDGSAEAIRAVEWAAREARLHGAPLRIVSVAELLPRMYAPPRGAHLETAGGNTDWALASAVKAAAAVEPGLVIDTDLIQGPPAETVARCGAGALMLVVGSRGSGAFSAMTLGSVGRYVATHAPCPVVLVREQTVAAHRQVVVGIRDPRDCAAAIGFAFEEAALRNASLLAVHAWQSPRSVPDPNAVAAAAVTELGAVLNEWRQKYPDVTASQDVVHGHPGRVLAGLSARADLVVLGRHETHGTHGRAVPGADRVVHAVLSHAHGPVAIIPSA